MYILAINGSHRKGNTEAMLKKILDGAASKGARIELVNLREKNVENCRACMGCENTGTCRIQDDFPLIFEKMAHADTVVFGSPPKIGFAAGWRKALAKKTFFPKTFLPKAISQTPRKAKLSGPHKLFGLQGFLKGFSSERKAFALNSLKKLFSASIIW